MKDRTWNLRVNLDTFNAAFAALDEPSERSDFLTGLYKGMNRGRVKDDCPDPMAVGFALGEEMRAEAEAFRVKSSVDGKRGYEAKSNRIEAPLKPPTQPPIEAPSSQSTIHNPQSLNDEPKKKKTPSWGVGYSPKIIETTGVILSFWPKRPATQPSGDPVPQSSGPQLASRLNSIAGQGGDLNVCVAIAKRFADEFKTGKWAKAAENFFGKSEDAPGNPITKPT